MRTADPENTLWHTIDTADGPFSIIENEHGVVLGSGWTSDRDAVVARSRLMGTPMPAGTARPSAAVDAVRAFYDGDITRITDVAVRQTGTGLQQSVWARLRTIEPGQCLTYGELAQAIARPRAIRAVASACARNAVGLFVPCHRVVAASGSLAGFAWGIAVKEKLLAREKGQAGVLSGS